MVLFVSEFRPDSCVVAEVRASPNHGERNGNMKPDMLVLHYTGMTDAQDAVRRLCSESSKVSSHYIVLEDGHIIQSVAESRRAWHAGESSWAGETDLNSRSIGIEIANPGHDHGYREFPNAQIAAVTALCRDIIVRHGIHPERVLAHSDVAPLRKEDPGEKFPWRRLHAAGVGHWAEPAPLATPGEPVTPGSQGSHVRELQAQFSRYGYGIGKTSTYDDLTTAVVRAFQRHFRPARIDGIADASTRATLAQLLESLPKAAVAAKSQPRTNS
jgi:N-acetylmuramoyl-L-alanine amidase